MLAHVEIENRMSTTPFALRTKGSRNLLWLSPPVLRPRAMGFLPRSFLTGRRIRAAAASVEVFIDQTSHQSTVRRHAIRLQRRCGGNQRRPRRIELRHLAQRGKIRSYSDSTVTVIPRLESDIRSKTDIGGSCKAAYRDPMSAVWVSF